MLFGELRPPCVKGAVERKRDWGIVHYPTTPPSRHTPCHLPLHRGGFGTVFFNASVYSGKSPLEGGFWVCETIWDQALYSAMNFRTAPRPTYLSSPSPTTSVGA